MIVYIVKKPQIFYINPEKLVTGDYMRKGVWVILLVPVFFFCP